MHNTPTVRTKHTLAYTTHKQSAHNTQQQAKHNTTQTTKQPQKKKPLREKEMEVRKVYWVVLLATVE